MASCLESGISAEPLKETDESKPSLILRASRGESEALHEIFNQYYKRVIGFVRRYVDESDVEDVTQEIFFKVFRNANNIMDYNAFESYLFRSAKNHCINWLRKKYRIRKALELYWITANTWKNHVEQEKVFSNFESVLQKVSPDSRKLLKMFYVYKYTRSEIASKLDLSPSTVYRKLASAKTELLKEANSLHMTVEFDGRHDIRVE